MASNRSSRYEATAPSLAKKLCSCIKKVRKTVKLRKETRGTTSANREKAAIGICIKSVVQRKEQRRTLRRFTCRNSKPTLITQKTLKPLPPSPKL